MTIFEKQIKTQGRDVCRSNLEGKPDREQKMAESVEMTDDTKMATCQSFSLLQSRKFLLPATKVAADADGNTDVNVNIDVVNETKRSTLRRLAKLCPSMDLILVQSTNSSPSSSPSLVIFRSLSWQRVADITLPESMGDTTAAAAAETTTENSSSTPLLSYCWSPNGQCVAAALESSIFLYGVESLVTALGAGGGGGGAMSGSSSNATWTIDLLGEQQEDSNRQQQPQSNSSSSSSNSSIDVLALNWVHVGKNHPTAAFPSATEEEQEVSWR